MAAQQALLDPDHDKLAYTCFDFLLIELVPLAQRIVADLHAKEALLLAQQQTQSHLSLSSLNSATTATTTSPTLVRKTLPDRTSAAAGLAGPADGLGESEKAPASVASTAATSTTAAADTASLGAGAAGAVGGIGGSGSKAQDTTQQLHPGAAATDDQHSTAFALDEETAREQVFHRLDDLGYRVGQGLVERFSAASPRANTSLDMIKFLCKDVWTLVFRKQIDNLKTNHRGTFVLTDARFPPLSRVSVDRGRGARGLDEALGKSQAFLWFPCGIIRGVLSGFGLDVTVQAETPDLKSAVFQIRTVGSKP